VRRNLFKDWSIKFRVTALALAIFAISIALLGYFAAHEMRGEMERALGNQQRATVSLVAAQINKEMAYRISALNFVAGNVNAGMLANPATLQKYIEQRKLFSLLFNAGIFVTRLDGTAMAELPRIGRVGLNYMDRDHIAAALREGKTTFGKPIIGKRVHAPSFAMTVPIRDAGGRVIGAVAGATDLSQTSFLDSVTEGQYGETGGYLIVDPAHNLFVSASNNKSLVMQSLPAPGVNPVLDRRLKGFDGSAVNVSSVGVEVLTASARLPAAGWFIIATLPTAEAFAPIVEIRRRMYLLVALIMVIAGAIMWWALRRQLEPLLVAVKTLADPLHADKLLPLPVADKDEVGNLIGAFNRLTEMLKSRNAALRSESEKNRFMLQHASDGIHILDLEGNVVECSESFCASLGYSPAEMIGMNVAEWDATWSEAELHRILNEQFAQGRRAQFETRHRRKDGAVFEVEVSGLPLAIDGRPFVFYSSRDITKRKYVEHKIKELNADLERRVRERTANLEAANKELDSFSYTIAHDLRAPVRAINGFCEMVLKGSAGKLDLQTSGYLKRIVAGGQHLANLIDDLLGMARMSRQEIRRKAIDLSELAKTAVASLAQANPQRDVRVAIQPGMSANADPGLICAVLENLIGNAWKFTAKSPAARIDVGVEDGDGESVYFVRDNGAGFDMQYAHKLFAPFQRLHHAIEFEGTGIGLATVKKIIGRHGGRVWIESAIGVGTTIFFTIGDAV